MGLKLIFDFYPCSGSLNLNLAELGKCSTIFMGPAKLILQIDTLKISFVQESCADHNSLPLHLPFAG